MDCGLLRSADFVGCGSGWQWWWVTVVAGCAWSFCWVVMVNDGVAWCGWVVHRHGSLSSVVGLGVLPWV